MLSLYQFPPLPPGSAIGKKWPGLIAWFGLPGLEAHLHPVIWSLWSGVVTGVLAVADGVVDIRIR